MKKVAYVSLRFTWSVGVYNKLISQSKAVKSEKIPIDFFWITNDDNILKFTKNTADMTLLHIKSTSQIITRIKQIKILKALLSKYEVLVIRYPLYDPILHLMLGKKENIIWEHHTKEFYELKNTSKFRYYLESFRKGILNKAIGYSSVTEDIMIEEAKDYSSSISKTVITNSLDFSTIPLPIQNILIPNINKIELVFVASSFKYWHGLEEVLQSVKKENRNDIALHIVGDVDNKYFDIINKENKYGVVFHGKLNKNELQELYVNASLGIGSFAFYKIGLNEGATLKVREYLASGLPVYAECKDSGLKNNFPFFKYEAKFDINKAITFIKSLNQFSKREVRDEANKYLDTKSLSKKLYNFSINCLEKV